METFLVIVAMIMIGVMVVPLAAVSLWLTIGFLAGTMIDLGEMWSEWRER